MKASYLSPAVGQYILAHSTQPDDLLDELAAETQQVAGSNAGMLISPDQGRFLTMITQLVRPELAVEVGTFTGYSSLCIARGLSGGRLRCFDVSEEWTSIARKYWEKAGVAARITLTLGPATESLRAMEDRIALAFIDADKTNYPAYYELVMERLRPGGVVLVDNTLWDGYVADPSYEDDMTRTIREFNDLVMNDPRVTSVMLPIGDGLTMIRKN
ncbi:O-methyltransferase [Nonomuraea africana]|uniref:Caffeoyl-CoA O-methyltransferase n=1 Tax=Nonomuraea africana TaxID=46171 RepID=A0ABR9KLS3_9ACTN|nr:O-methyltransferase [Nonomuraea africana]MBE1562967.1 caffeoyl-CoA O-methyltransferase [Nonomuraea africana]